MSSNCPIAPAVGSAALVVQTTDLPSGKVLFRFHKGIYAADSFNPNTGRRIDLPEAGARFNPFPGAPATNIPTLYAADTLTAAALESVFHDVAHVPSPTYPRSRLAEWSYSKLRTTRRLLLLKLVNPQLRQLSVPGRASSIREGELIHTPPSEYPHTRTWARFLHASIPDLDGLAWRPRLGGTGLSYVLFGDRCEHGDLQIHSPAIAVAMGPGFSRVYTIATGASISIVDP
ncbi:MAG: RES domain-containing protein [Terriglobales bacterium]